MDRMQSASRTIVVLGTGGTIAGSAASADDNVAYRAATLPVAALVGSLSLPAGVAIESEQVAQLDSKDMDFATWRALAACVAGHLARPEVAAVVVTHAADPAIDPAQPVTRQPPRPDRARASGWCDQCAGIGKTGPGWSRCWRT